MSQILQIFKDYQLGGAVISGNLSRVKTLLEQGANIEKKFWKGSTPLVLAVMNGYLPIVKELLLRGANIGALVKLRGTAGITRVSLLSGAVLKDRMDIMKEVLQAGANIDTQVGIDNWTVLHFAAFNGKLEIVRVLLQAGAKTETLDSDGDTALQLAQKAGHKKVVQLLKTHQDVTKPNVAKLQQLTEEEEAHLKAIIDEMFKKGDLVKIDT